jgi:predicted metal-binding membrane protein
MTGHHASPMPPAAPVAVAGIPRRDRLIITTCVLLTAGLAWAYLVRLGLRMSSSVTSPTAMAGMGMRMDAPWQAADFVFTFTMWAVMMVGMMSATAAPVLLVFAASHARRVPSGRPTMSLLFGLGYLVIWVGFSALATVAQWGLHNAALLSPAMTVESARIAGALLIIAGVYQLTPMKNACLAHCQSPLAFLMHHWRDGRTGAFRMGLEHGLYCLGCCWALMVVLFAVGVMNLVWVAALTIFILLERVGRGGAIVSRVGGVALAVLGALLVASAKR